MGIEGAAGHDRVPSRSGTTLEGRGHDIGVRVLVANGPGMYREVISSTLEVLRPGVEVFTAEPADLEEEFLRLLPHLVICSQTTKHVELGAPVWVELYPNGAPCAVVKYLDGSRRTLPSIGFDTLLSVVDGIRDGDPTSPRVGGDGAPAG